MAKRGSRARIAGLPPILAEGAATIAEAADDKAGARNFSSKTKTKSPAPARSMGATPRISISGLPESSPAAISDNFLSFTLFVEFRDDHFRQVHAAGDDHLLVEHGVEADFLGDFLDGLKNL